MKKISIALISLILIFSFVSCSSPVYSDTKSASELGGAVMSSFSTEGGMKVLDADAILEISPESITYLKDFVMIRANNAKNVNEYGIFRVEAGKANDMKALVDKYVENKKTSYLAMNYLPEETQKIENASARIFGNYVVYSFLSEDDAAALDDAIKSILSE